MKKITILITLFILCAATLFAQAPEKFTYQAVVRNASNALVANAQVGVRVNILQGSATGNAVYSESHVVTTNANGLVTVNIGGGSVLHGSFVGINWADGPYFLKTDIDPNGGNDYSITSTQQLLSVPYALYATEAANGFSGDYNDLVNVPQIPQIPADISAFNNDAGYITMDSVPAIPTNVSAFTNDAGYLTSYTETDPQFNAWDKDYNDLINKPVIPTVPTNVSAFNNDAGYITVAQVPAQVNADWTATTGAAQILNKPTIPTNVSAFNNDAGYITVAQVPAQVNADWNAITGAAQILNKPPLFSGNYNDLTHKPDIPTVPTNVSAFNNDAGYITGYTETDPLFTAWNKDYNDLINTPIIPTVPTNLSAFTNDVGYITEADVQQAANIPTNVSELTNDVGYITSYTETDPLFTAWGKNYNTLTNKPDLAPVATTGSYNDLTDRPQIPENVSAFTNDAGYITSYTETDPQFNAWNKNYYDLINRPQNVSTFYNDAHYITDVELSNLLAAMNSALAALNNTIDSLRDRIEELENGGTPVPPDPVNPDTTVTPGSSVIMDGLACPGTPTVTDVDGNLYHTIAIGQQCWMKENLRTTKYYDETPIPSATTATSSTARYRYYPGGDETNASTFGCLYNWQAIMYGSVSSNTNPSNVTGVCPSGWHVPSNEEWTQLKVYVSSKNDNRCGGNTQNIAKALASTESWVSNSISCAVGDYAPNNNTTGFSALAAGDNNGNMGANANFWSCTQSNSNATAYAVQFVNTSPTMTVNDGAAKENGYSVRCVRNTPIEAGVAQMVVTGEVSGISITMANCGGTVNADGAQVSSRGVCWSQMPNPTVEGGHSVSGNGAGSFTVSLTGLQPGTIYYVRAYVTTSVGIAYGNTVTFTTQPDASACGTASITDYDGNSYNTVKIGNQCWMKENLRTTHYADGTVIPAGSTNSSTACYYTPSGTSAYGYLYNWPAVMHGATSSSSNPSNVRGLCPIGWHVPSDAEWSELTASVSSQPDNCCDGNVQNIAKALASKTGWISSTTTCSVGNEPGTNNHSGFSALPVGYFSLVAGGYAHQGRYAYFWSATSASDYYARYRWIQFRSAVVDNLSDYKSSSCSVRCLRD